MGCVFSWPLKALPRGVSESSDTRSRRLGRVRLQSPVSTGCSSSSQHRALAYGSYIAPFKLGDKIYAPDYNGCAFAIYSMPESLYSESFSSPGGLTQKRFVAVHSYRTVSASDGAFGIPPRMLLDYSGLGNEVTTASGDGKPHFAHDQRKGSIWSILQLPDEQRPKATRGWTECVPPIKTGSNPIPARAGIGEINQVFVESRLEGGKAVMYVSVRSNSGGVFKRYLRHEC